MKKFMNFLFFWILENKKISGKQKIQKKVSPKKFLEIQKIKKLFFQTKNIFRKSSFSKKVFFLPFTGKLFLFFFFF